jgi:hypothetical protein
MIEVNFFGCTDWQNNQIAFWYYQMELPLTKRLRSQQAFQVAGPVLPEVCVMRHRAAKHVRVG